LSRSTGLQGALFAEDLASPELGRRIESPKREISLAYALQRGPNAEGDQHFMVSQSLAALHEAEVPYQAVASAAHAGEPAILPSQHPVSMHRPAIPSILDTNRFRFVHGRTNRGCIFSFRQTLTIRNFSCAMRISLGCGEIRHNEGEASIYARNASTRPVGLGQGRCAGRHCRVGGLKSFDVANPMAATPYARCVIWRTSEYPFRKIP
jgi:hypothetical protein